MISLFSFFFSDSRPTQSHRLNEMEYDGYVNGGNSSDDSDDEELMLAFAAFILAGLAFFDPYINSGQRRRIRDGAQSGAQYVIEPINGIETEYSTTFEWKLPFSSNCVTCWFRGAIGCPTRHNGWGFMSPLLYACCV